jgi:hypothetical protein
MLRSQLLELGERDVPGVVVICDAEFTADASSDLIIVKLNLKFYHD